jgi:hypothetical protein
MKFVEPSHFTDPDAAARKLLEIANATEPAQDGRPLLVGRQDRSRQEGLLFQFFHLCRQIGISANSVGGILARQNPDLVIRL